MNTPIPQYLKRLLQTEQDPPAALAPAATTDSSSFAAIRREIPWPLPPEHLDAEACNVVRRLSASGFETYLVGGCVRDLMFGLRPKDFDVVTSATPRDVKRIFRNCRIIGRRFRLAHVFFRDKIIEVATFRAGAAGAPDAAVLDPDGATSAASEAAALSTDAPITPDQPSAPSDSAEPLIIRDDNVFGSAEQDAVRRDFSFNALFYDVERETIIDYVGGVHDVERRLLRSIGDPSIRMREDPIRMLRAIRLAARLGCRIDESTWEAIRRFHPEITHAAAPRVLEDLLRMFRGGAAAPAFEMLVASGAICTVLPELADHLQRVSRQSGGEEAEALRSALLVADAWTHSGRKLSDAVSLALLLGTPVLSRLHDPAERLGSGASLAIVGDGLRPAAQRLSISKRDMERIRQVLLNVGKLAARGGRRRRHAATLARRNYFPDTLDLFEILSHATGDLSEEVTRWRRRAQDGGASEDGATEGETEAREPREAPRRRRRRGGRRTRPPEA